MPNAPTPLTLFEDLLDEPSTKAPKKPSKNTQPKKNPKPASVMNKTRERATSADNASLDTAVPTQANLHTKTPSRTAIQKATPQTTQENTSQNTDNQRTSALSPPPKKTAHHLRILHTADWHIGKRLHNEARYADFSAFLDWLLDVLKTEAVDILVVAGDIFDTMTPSNKAQELYYEFLANALKTTCQHIIIIAGNHDSPSFLDAPKSLFHHFNTHIIGTPKAPEDEVITLKDDTGSPCAIIAAVPYLRDKDVRVSTFGESLADKDKNTVLGIQSHYQAVGEYCESLKARLKNTHGKPLPVIATGHLFAAGASAAAIDDGMRQLYVGSLGVVGADSFPAVFDYVALGHIHAEQTIGGKRHIRYSGSPLAMGFGESYQQKKVLLIDFDQTANTPTPEIHTLDVPRFRQLERITGDLPSIEAALDKFIIKRQADNTDPLNDIWLDIEYTGTPIATLATHIFERLAGTGVFALNIKSRSTRLARIQKQDHTPRLDALKPADVFAELINQKNTEPEDAPALKAAHELLLQRLFETDSHAV
ncbi:MAG: exonuclease SbcCD subunit D C-terminal domain-containing protein [Moraxella sp.]|nr:exonuclease SbcCD subunit D C-terminal domain-containing protein [Moraxella sp.]